MKITRAGATYGTGPTYEPKEKLTPEELEKFMFKNEHTVTTYPQRSEYWWNRAAAGQEDAADCAKKAEMTDRLIERELATLKATVQTVLTFTPTQTEERNYARQFVANEIRRLMKTGHYRTEDLLIELYVVGCAHRGTLGPVLNLKFPLKGKQTNR